MSPSRLMQAARAMAVGLVLAAAALVGLAPGESAAGPASSFGVAADDPGQPPAPNTDASANPAPPQTVPPLHRRHIDSDPNLRR
jgi:hypothetical protein